MAYMNQICEAIAVEQDRPFAQVHASVTAFVEQVIERVAAGQAVTIRRLGVFCRRKLGRRRGRNPRTGQTIMFGPSVLPRFRPSESFKAMLRESE